MGRSMCLPNQGEEFARAPVGPSLEEQRQKVLRLYKAHWPECLKTWVELELEKEGGEAIFTPLDLCVFQPIEHYWAYLKGNISRQYFRIEILTGYRTEYKFILRRLGLFSALYVANGGATLTMLNMS